MRKTFVSLLSLTLALSAQARDFAAIKKSGTIVMATEGTFSPFNEFKGKKLSGFEVEVAEAVAQTLGLKVEWKTFPFDSLLIGLGQDRYDLVAASHGITSERAKAVDFTSPHYCTGGVVFTKEGGPTTGAALKGKTISVQVGTTYLTHLKKMKDLKEVKTYPRDTDALQNLLQGRVDAWVTDKFVGLHGAQANAGRVKIVPGEMLFQEKVGMAVAKGNESLRREVNQALEKVIKDGRYEAISKKYFGEDIRCH